MQVIAKESPLTAETSMDTETLKITEEAAPAAEKKTTQEPTKLRCNHHLGYLSERSNKEKIPEECITCTDIINCMLKNLKNLKDRKNK